MEVVTDWYSENWKTPPPLQTYKLDEKKLIEIHPLNQNQPIYFRENKTHPDKLINIDEGQAEDLKNLYNEASVAKSNNDLDSLFRIASKLNIENEEVTIDSINRIEQLIKEKEDYIEKIHKDVAWIWYYANKKERDIILENIFSKMCN